MKTTTRFYLSLFFVFGLGVYIFLRLTHIMTLPIFTDEAIYVRWAQIAKNDASWRFISLTDGKQPLFIWIAMAVMKYVKDPLLAGRLVSVGAGAATSLGLFFLAKELFKNIWVGVVCAFLYIFYPFGLVYDRMALYDSLVSAFAVWGLYAEVLLIRRIRPELAFITGLVVGGGVLTKTNAFFNVYFLPFTLILFNFRQQRWFSQFFRWVVYALLATGLVYLYYSILRLSPFFGIIAQKDQTFIYSFHDWLLHPFTFFIGNFQGLFNWFVSYFTLLYALLAACSFLVFRSFWREKILLLLWSGVPIIALALFGKVLYPRYVLPMSVTLLPLLALTIVYLLSKLRFQWLRIVAFLIIISLWLWKDYFIIYDFAHAPIAPPDLQQYVNNWPAGGGVKEMIAFFSTQAAHQKIYVLTQGTFGSIPTLSLEIYLDTNTNIQKRGLWPIPATIPVDLLEKAKSIPVYVVFDQTDIPSGWVHLVPVVKYQKGIGNAYLRIYKVDPHV